jgi:hypothetical protein
MELVSVKEYFPESCKITMICAVYVGNKQGLKYVKSLGNGSEVLLGNTVVVLSKLVIL